EDRTPAPAETERSLGDRFAGLTGKRFDLNATERRLLELELAPVERLRRGAAKIELKALLEARAYAIERLGLPEDCQVRIAREAGLPVAIEVVEPHAPTSCEGQGEHSP